MPNININFSIFSPQDFVTKGCILTIYRAQKLPYSSLSMNSSQRKAALLSDHRECLFVCFRNIPAPFRPGVHCSLLHFKSSGGGHAGAVLPPVPGRGCEQAPYVRKTSQNSLPLLGAQSGKREAKWGCEADMGLQCPAALSCSSSSKSAKEDG